MKTLVVMTSLGVLASSGAIAADVAIKANATEILEASDNYFLVNTPSGTTVKSLTAGTLDVLTRTPTTNYLLNSYYSYYKYFGPGTADTSLTFGTPAHARFSVDHTDQLTKYNAAASWTRSDVATTQLAETGRTSASRGSINTYAVDGGLIHDLSRTDSLTWTARATQVAYSNDPTALPYDDVISTAAWKHSLSPTTVLTNFVSFDYFLADNIQQTQRLFWKAMTGLDSKLSPRLTFTGNVGWAFVNAYQNGIASAVGQRHIIRATGWNGQLLAGRYRADLSIVEKDETIVDRRASCCTADYRSAAEKRFNRVDPQSRYQFPVEPVVCGPICPYPSDVG